MTFLSQPTVAEEWRDRYNSLQFFLDITLGKAGPHSSTKENQFMEFWFNFFTGCHPTNRQSTERQRYSTKQLNSAENFSYKTRLQWKKLCSYLKKLE